VDNNQVTFSYKDYADEGKQKTMSVSSVEFIRRFMLHILPEKFVRIRHYGFLSNKSKARKIKLIKALLAGQPAPVEEVKTEATTEVTTETNTTPETKESKIKTNILCPFCKIGTLQKGAVVRPVVRIRRALRVFSN
jgi:hypothetical protein